MKYPLTIHILKMIYIRMKISFLLLLLCSITSHAQTIQQVPDSVVHVKARWCKGDTMRYQYEQAQFRINRHDTLCTEYTRQEMTFVVCDSTNKGFLIEYVPTLLESRLPSDTSQQAVRTHIIRQLHQQHVLFKTDRTGAVQHIENWRQLKDTLQTCLGQLLDDTYNQGAGNLMPRKRIEALLCMEFATEENLRNSLEELELLFGLHGIMSPIGQQTLHETAEYPTEGHITASYGPYGKQGFTDDYSLFIQSHTKVPADEAKGMADQMMDIVMADNLIGKVNHLIGGSKDDLDIANNEEYHYFFNGWPSMIMRQQNIHYGSVQSIKMKRVEWTRRTWAEQPTYGRKDKNM